MQGHDAAVCVLRSLTAHIPAFCCQAFEWLLAGSSDEVGRLIHARAGWDRLSGSGFYDLPTLEGACRASCCCGAAHVCACCCCCRCCTVLTTPPCQLRIADLAVGALGTDAAHYSYLMQPGLDGCALRALVMQSLALEEPVPLGLALRSVGAEGPAGEFVQGTRAFRQETANAALRAAGCPALRAC